MSSDARCFVCVGKDCRRDDGYRELRSAVAVLDKVRRVACQDLCTGPVAGVEIDGQIEWFEKVRKGREREAIVTIARRGARKVPSELKPRWNRKRSGKVKR